MLTQSPEKTVTCTIVGDGMVGKTHICKTFAGKEHNEDYIATVSDEYIVTTEMVGDTYNIRIVDSSGQFDYKDIRTKSYKDSDVFLVCYSIKDRDSFESVKTFWVSEIRKICKKTPLIFVATGRESRDNNDNISKQEGLDIMDKFGAKAYIECECNNKDDVTEVFEDALLSVMKHRKRRRSSLLHSLINR